MVEDAGVDELLLVASVLAVLELLLSAVSASIVVLLLLIPLMLIGVSFARHPTTINGV